MSTASAELHFPPSADDSASLSQQRSCLLSMFDLASAASKAYILGVAHSLVVDDTVAALSVMPPPADRQLRLVGGNTLFG